MYVANKKVKSVQSENKTGEKLAAYIYKVSASFKGRTNEDRQEVWKCFQVDGSIFDLFYLFSSYLCISSLR